MLALVLPPMAAHAAGPAYRVSDDGRYLVDAQGEPFFWQGDTEWELLYALSAQDAKALLHARRAQGFTVVQAMCDGLYPRWIAADQLPPPQARMPWLNDNPLTPSEAFFTRADAIVAAAQAEHVLLLIGVYHIDDVKMKRITPKNIGIWTRWLAHRYRNAPNIIWTMYSDLQPASFPMVQAAVKGLRQGDGGRHLVTLHPEGVAGSSSAVPADLSLNTFQSLSTGYVNYQLARADYARTPVKPVVNGEARYEAEHGTTALEVRRSAWWSYLGGAAFSYGHVNNWTSPGSWREWVNAPGARQIQVLGSLLRSLSWWKLIPDPGVMVDGGEAAAARSADGAWIVAYLATNAPVKLSLNALDASTARLSWINPVDGERRPVGLYPTAASVSVQPPAGWLDAVLLAEKASE